MLLHKNNFYGEVYLQDKRLPCAPQTIKQKQNESIIQDIYLQEFAKWSLWWQIKNVLVIPQNI